MALLRLVGPWVQKWVIDDVLLDKRGVGSVMYYFTSEIPAMGSLYQHILPDTLFYGVWSFSAL